MRPCTNFPRVAVIKDRGRLGRPVVKSHTSAAIWRNLNRFLYFYVALGFIEIGFARRIFADFGHVTFGRGCGTQWHKMALFRALDVPSRQTFGRSKAAWTSDGGLHCARFQLLTWLSLAPEHAGRLEGAAAQRSNLSNQCVTMAQNANLCHSLLRAAGLGTAAHTSIAAAG